MSTSEDKLRQIRITIEGRIGELAPAKLDCAKGCAYCCRGYPISVHSLAEARLALEEAKRTYTPRAFKKLREDIYRQFRETRYLTTIDAFNQLKLPCPFLVKGACSVYEARPISCRTCISNDVVVCMSALGPPACKLTGDADMQRYLNAIYRYREDLYRELGYGDCMLELRAALVYVLEGGTPAPGNLPIDPLHAATPVGQAALAQSRSS